MKTLTKAQLLHLHEKLLEKTGGLPGIRDESLLNSSLAGPFQTFDGVEFYPTVVGKIARTSYNLVCNHPFIDGNKRIGMLVMLVLLELNEITVEFSDEEIIKIGLDLAKGTVTDRQLAEMINSHIK
ncbi:MAG: Fic family protein [Fusobacteriaceae bacterium]|jgi:death-on-curing protein|nr:Fic family protein [Fusobacteriaceae bacterium]